MMIQSDISSWDEVGEELSNQVQDTKKPEVAIPAQNLPSPRELTERFRFANIVSLQKGSDYVYRERKEELHLQVRIYPEGNIGDYMYGYDNHDFRVYHVQLDQHNPFAGPDDAVAHFFEDIFGIEIKLLDKI